jgi:histidine triad (HIT) family protein
MSPQSSSRAASLTVPDCLFCRIVAGEVPSDQVAATDTVVAFRDIAPQAPLHVLVVPRDHHGDVAQLAAADPALLADVVRTANDVAEDLADGQFRMIFNTGARSGQSVFHVHAHVLAGAQLGWTPA